MKTILLILGSEPHGVARGDYNAGLWQTAIDTLSPHYEILTSNIGEGYDKEEEIAKFRKADAVIYQYPVFWFMVPAKLKRYLDEVYDYDVFFSHGNGAYGSGGLMTGKKVMLSTTWNAPQEAFNDEAAFFQGKSLDEALFPMRRTHAYCGFEEMPGFAVNNIVQNPQFEADAARYAAHLRQHFPAAAEAAA